MASTRRRLAATGIVVLVLGTAGVIWLLSPPMNHVPVDVSDIPANTVFLCLLAERDGTAAPMDWSFFMFVWETTPPGDSTASLVDEGATTHKGTVRYRSCDRLGVLTCSGERNWSIRWFEPAQVVEMGTFAPSRITCSLDEPVESEQLTEREVRDLGVEDAP